MKKRAIVLLAVLLLGVLCGCFSTEDFKDLPGGELLGEAENPGQPSAPSGPLTLYYYAGESLNPLLSASRANREVGQLLYEPVVALDENQKPVPGAAEFQVENGSIFLTLNGSRRFSDGTAMTLSHIKRSIDTALKNPGAEFGAVAGQVSATVLTRDGRLELKGDNLSYHELALLNLPVVKEAEDPACTVGSGRYAFDRTDSKTATLRRTEGADAGLPETIRLLSVPDEGVVNLSFQAGTIDVLSLTAGGEDNLSYTGSAHEFPYPSRNLVFLSVNAAEPLLGAEVRQFLNQSLDRDKLSLSGSVKVDAPFYPNLWALEQKEGQSPEQSGVYEIWGRQESRTFTLLVSAESDQKQQLATKASEQLSLFGLDVEVAALPFEEYQQRLDRGDFDFALVELKLDSRGDLSPLLGTSGACNYGGYSSARMDGALDVLRTAGNETAYRAAAEALRETFYEEAPILPLFYRNATVLTSAKVEGLSPLPNDVYHGLKSSAKE